MIIAAIRPETGLHANLTGFCAIAALSLEVAIRLSKTSTTVKTTTISSNRDSEPLRQTRDTCPR